MIAPTPTTPVGPLDTVYCGYCDPKYGTRVVADGMAMDPEVARGIVFVDPIPFGWGHPDLWAQSLAVALLLSATRGNRECALDLYYRYTVEVVAGWTDRFWVTTRAAILRWIGEQPGHLGGRESAAEGGGL